MSERRSAVLLAGGVGSRLKNPVYNKHLAIVNEKLMVEYPLRTLGAMGCTDVVIVGSPESTPDLVRLIGDGSDYSLGATYKVQKVPRGAADALGRAKGLVEGTFPVLCGDVYFDPAPELTDKPTLYWTHLDTANQHSVFDPEANVVVEKPKQNLGKRAVVAYMYDDTVFDLIPELEPSERGELELVDIHNFYLSVGADVKEYKGFFGDMGSPQGLLRVANHIRSPWRQ